MVEWDFDAGRVFEEIDPVYRLKARKRRAIWKTKEKEANKDESERKE